MESSKELSGIKSRDDERKCNRHREQSTAKGYVACRLCILVEYRQPVATQTLNKPLNQRQTIFFRLVITKFSVEGYILGISS